MPERAATIDWLVLTALSLEHRAVLAHLPPGESIAIGGRTGLLTAVGPSRVAAVCVEAMGGVAPGTAAADAVRRLAPRNVVLAGIAGGVRKDGDRYLGDVLVAEQVVEYDLGKDSPGEFERRFEVFRPTFGLLRHARQVAERDWQKFVSAPRPDRTTGRVLPHAQFGVLASGNQVVTNPLLIADLQEHWRKLVGLEMEGHAVARAAYEARGPTGFLFVKGICDWADPQKKDGWQPYAADAAAAFVRALLGGPELPASGPQPTQTDVVVLRLRAVLPGEIVRGAVREVTGIEFPAIDIRPSDLGVVARLAGTPEDRDRLVKVRFDSGRLSQLAGRIGLTAIEWADRDRQYETLFLPIATPPPPPRPAAVIDERMLRGLISGAFDLEELGLLCADTEADLAAAGVSVPVSLDHVGGNGLAARVAQLIAYLKRRGHLGALVAAVRRGRPGLLESEGM